MGTSKKENQQMLGVFLFLFFDSCLSGLWELLCAGLSLLMLPCSVFLCSSLSICVSFSLSVSVFQTLCLSLYLSLSPSVSFFPLWGPSCGKSQNSASGSWPVSLILDIWDRGLAGGGWSLSRVSRWPAIPTCQNAPLAPIPHNRVFTLFPPHLSPRPVGPF